MGRRIFTVALFGAMLVLCSAGWAGTEAPMAISVTPNQIQMGATYNGRTVVVSGGIPAGSDVLVRVVGKAEDLKFKKKGKVMGLLWMNLDTVEFNQVPAMFLLLPSKGLAGMMSDRPDAWRKLGLGFDALKKDIQVFPEKEDKDTLFDDLVKLKKKQGLFGVQENALTCSTGEGAGKFTAGIRFPSALPEGSYEIQVYAIKGGKVISLNRQGIQAREVGLPAFLTSLAFKHSLLYGILAVLVAVFAGLLTGILFKGGGGAH